MNLKFKTLTTSVDYNTELEIETYSKNGVRMKKQKSSCSIIFFVCLLIFFISCSSAKIYIKPDAMSYITRHKTLAILPPKVKIDIKNNNKVSLENNQEQERIETIKAQNVMYSYLLKQVQNGKIYLDIQDVEKTNVMLLKLGYPDRIGANMTPEKIARALGVDAVLLSNYVYSKNGWGLLVTTYSVNANLRLFDRQTGYMLWNYNRSRNINSITEEVLIGEAIKKIPYCKK